MHRDNPLVKFDFVKTARISVLTFLGGTVLILFGTLSKPLLNEIFKILLSFHQSVTFIVYGIWYASLCALICATRTAFNLSNDGIHIEKWLVRPTRWTLRALCVYLSIIFAIYVTSSLTMTSEEQVLIEFLVAITTFITVLCFSLVLILHSNFKSSLNNWFLKRLRGSFIHAIYVLNAGIVVGFLVLMVNTLSNNYFFRIPIELNTQQLTSRHLFTHFAHHHVAGAKVAIVLAMGLNDSNQVAPHIAT